jgi:protein involved in polysaccharide export with SLBB domain
LLILLSAGLSASAQTTTDPLQALKDTLGGGQGGGILQGVLGNGTKNPKKSDEKLETPETVTPPENEDITEKNIKTRDGRILRQFNEDPELRPDDSVMIEMRSVDEVCANANANGGPNAPNGTGNPANPAPSGQVNNALNTLSVLGPAAAAVGPAGVQAGAANGAQGLGGLSSLTGIGGLNPNANNANANNSNWFDLTRCSASKTDQTDKTEKTDEQKMDIEKFQKRILAGNPYKLNRFGVLEVPGLPAMPLAGLTASEATKRLGADPDLDNYFVRMTLLRLMPAGDEALKQFGYDLFEGVPSTFAPVSDIQVPMDYIVGPGDTLVIQLYGNEPQTYELTVERDGRINFPKIGPIMVTGMTFDAARGTIEGRVAKQLIGSRVSVTMGDLRSIRVFVLGEAEKPGSYTVSGLSTMTNALFVSGGVKKIGSLRNIQLKRDGRLVSTLDLYDLLLHGDNSADHQLLPGDVIFIPPIGNTVAVFGSVRRPAIYELKTEKTVGQAIALAGGLSSASDAQRRSDHRRWRSDDPRGRRQAEGSGNTADAREFREAVRLRISAGCICVPPRSAPHRHPQELRRVETGSRSSLHHDSPRGTAHAQHAGDFRGPQAGAGRPAFRRGSRIARTRRNHGVQLVVEPGTAPGADHPGSRASGDTG